MSAQPQAIDEKKIDQKEKDLRAKKRMELRSDVLYIAGATLICLGLGGIRWYLAPIAAGCFAMLMPMMEVITAFVRGLRRK
jgi:hypothetical protein